MKYGQLHYRCVVDLLPAKGKQLAARDVQDILRNWTRSKIAPLFASSFDGDWFYDGGKWEDSLAPKVCHAETLCLAGGGESGKQTDCWAYHYQHQDADVPSRQWELDAGLLVDPAGRPAGTIRFSASLYYGYSDTALGKRPRAPDPSTPGFVRDILNLKNAVPRIGDQDILSYPIALKNADDSQFIRETLVSVERTVAVVMLTQDQDAGTYLVDPNELAAVVRGTALVFKVSGKGLNSALKKFPPAHRCADGNIRIYWPGVNFDDPANGKLHKMIDSKEVGRLGEKAVIRWIASTVAAREIRGIEAVTSLDDIRSRASRQRIDALKAEVTASIPAARKDEFEELIKLYDQDKQRLVAENRELTNLADSIQQDLDDNRDVLERERIYAQHLKGENERISLDLANSLEKQRSIGSLTELPESLSEIVEIFRGIFADRISFTDQGLKSAKSYKRDDNRTIQDAWKCLWAVSHDLYDIFHENVSGDLEELFHLKSSGYHLAMTETASTKKNPSLARKREDIYDGRKIDITPHVKGKAEHFRVYFCWDQPTQKIVIGHIGDHLDTAGTKRM